jgi:hypothetical protein
MKSKRAELPFTSTPTHASACRRKRIAKLLSAMAFTAALSTQAVTIVVNASGDTIGAGDCTLRAAVASINTAALQGACSNTGGAFGTGDVISFAPAVTAITLNDTANNSLNVTVNTLVINGGTGVSVNRPTTHTNLFRIFNHTGTGQFTLQGVNLQGGRTNAASARGGAVFSAGRLSLQNLRLQDNQTLGNASHGGAAHSDGAMDVVNCYVTANSTRGNSSPGGALSSAAFMTVQSSTITGNETVGADSVGGGLAAIGGLDLISTDLSANALRDTNVPRGIQPRGGGAHVSGATRVLNSRVTGNSVERGEGGGLAVVANAGITVEQSTFEANVATVSGGALFMFSSNSSSTITNSTFAGNSVTTTGVIAGNGGAILNLGRLAIRNSTFSGNRADGRGGAILNNGGAIALNSSIFANSISQSGTNVDIDNASGISAITGANNLVRGVSGVTLPGGTLTTDPLLGALADNGCAAPAGAANFTACPRTMLPGAGSPAINAGNNVSGALYDQRGAGFPRVLGASADIGAVEAGGAAVTTWPVTVTLTGAAGGGGVLCTPNPVPNGQSATCQATANAGYQFVSFSGDCTGATCTLTNVTAARNVSALFALINLPVATPTVSVPTLGEWALIGLMLLLSVVASVRLKASRGVRRAARLRVDQSA